MPQVIRARNLGAVYRLEAARILRLTNPSLVAAEEMLRRAAIEDAHDREIRRASRLELEHCWAVAS